jgi:pilus assembly protein CpaF
MRPDRLVVGEVRGAEALDLLQALNTGHEGSISTVHANGPLDALRRLSTLALFGGTGLPHDAICEQLRASVDVVIQVARGAGGARAVVAVVEVVDAPGPFTCRPLLVRDADGLRSVGAPERVGRRGSTP